MNAPHALAPPPRPRLVEHDEQTGLTALLELFSAEESSPGTHRAVRHPRPSLRASGARAVAWTRASSQRAASWGAGPQGAWRAW